MPKNIQQRYVFKINSSRFRENDWNLKLSIEDATSNDELVPISEGQIIRFIDKINGTSQDEINNIINKTRNEIKNIKNKDVSWENKRKLQLLYRKITQLTFLPEYLCIEMNSKKDFDKCCKGVVLNNLKYKRFIGTPNGVKKNIIVFVCEKNSQGKSIFDVLVSKMNNNRNTNVKFVPAKLEAYKALICSSSVPVSNPKVIVVKDCINIFKSDYIEIDDSFEGEPRIQIKKQGNVELNTNDGFGLISPSQSKKWSEELKEDYLISGFCIRNSFCKGMLYCFDFHEFARQYAKTDFIEDIWGNSYNIYEADVILTESMLKLWQSYNSYEDYNEHCQKNGYTFSVTKVSPHILEDTRTLNYQFIQTYDLSDEDLRKLCKPTISEYKDILGLDINKTILFTKGKKMSKDKIKELDYDIFTALMIEPSLINDKFVRTKIYKLLKKRIEQAKIGKIKVDGNYQLISGDPFLLCQSMFNLEKKGLLKKGECYSKYWIDNNVGEVTCFRAPMSSRNNIVKLNLSNNKDASFWYQYMNTIFILNGWDMSTHSLNGCDFDGDLLLSTNNSVLQNNTKNNLPILCVQKNAEKFIVTEKLSSKGNKASFGDEIGSITNKITSMFDLQCLFDKDSREYKTLDYRVLCGQQLQQNSIDKAKGIISKPMPKNWYNIFSIIKNNDLSDEEKNTLKSICVNKKPYFMNYIYPKDMKSYKKYIEDSNRKCLISFGMPIKELQEKRYKNKEELEFLKYFNDYLPCTKNSCVMNRICLKYK